VDGWEVEDVEAQLGEARQLSANPSEAAPGAREELVPGAEAGEHAVDVDVVGRRPHLLRARARRGSERSLDGQLLGAAQHGALGQLTGDVFLAGRDLASQLLLEAMRRGDPGLDPE
jgi:hypothetical protein